MDADRRETWTNRRIILVTAGVMIVVTLIWRLPDSLAYIAERLTELIILFIAAAVLAYILKPLVDFFAESPRLGNGSPRARMVAALLVLLMLIAGFIAGTWWAVTKVTKELRDAGWIEETRFDTKKGREEIGKKEREEIRKKERERIRLRIQQRVSDIMNYYNSVLPAEIRPTVNEWLNSAATSLFLSVSQGAKRTVQWLRLIAELFLVPILTFYFLTDAKNLRRELWLLVPPRYERQAQSLLVELDQVMNGYVRGQVILCAIATVVVTAGMLALNLRFALPLGLAAGACRAIPFVGPVLGAIPLIIAAWLQTKNINTTLIVLIGSSVMHFVESKFITPKVIGYKVGLHPVIIIAALMIGWEFFGVIGMFLAAPVVAMLKIILVHSREGWRSNEAVTETSG